MKRFLKVLGILILLIVAAAIILPIVFKDEIVARAKTEINKNLNATVDFEDIDISLFRSFPDFSLNIENTTVDGTGNFEGTRLAEIKDFTVDLDLFSVISGNQFEIERIALKDANIHVVIDTSGNANYDIVKPADDSTTADTAAPAEFKFTLKSYQAENLNLIYDDKEGDIFALLTGLNHEGSGDFTERIVDLKTKTAIEALTVKYGGIAYLNRVKATADADFQYDQEAYKLTFGENQLTLNDLLLKFTGSVALPDESVEMDLAFNSPDNNFKSLLSLIPAVYLEGFEDVKTTGDFSFAGTVNGTYDYEDVYPQYDVKFNINNASFRYPDLPAGVENIAVDARVYNTSSDLDGTIINIPTASATVAGSPVTARLYLSKPISNPTFDVYLKTDMELSKLGTVVPASDFDYSGHVMANVELAGNMADIDNERYENIKADGKITASNVLLKNDSLPYDIGVSEMDVNFTPSEVVLNSFSSQIGKSDLSANGSVKNIMGYALQDKDLIAEFSLNSNLLDLNQLSSGMDTPEAQEENAPAEETSAMEAIRIPENLDITLNTRVERLLYDNLEITGVQGAVVIDEGKANLNNLVMQLLGGNLVLSGAYDSKPALPVVDMEFKINNFGFRESFENLVTIQKLAPIMQNTTGTYSTGFNFSSRLNADMTPDFTTVQAAGSLNTSNLETSPKSLERLAGILKNPDLATLDIGNVNLDFEIENGRVEVKPFDFTAGNVAATVSGTSGLDQTLDYTMDLKVPVSGIGATDLLNKVGVTQGGKMDLAVKIGGTFSDPKVTTSLSDLAGNVVDNIKDKAREKITEAKDEAISKANEKVKQYIDEAEKRGDALIAEAEKQAATLRSEAQKRAEQLRSEGYAQADKLMAEAKGNFLKEQGAKIAADKLKQESDQKANLVINEANKKAQDLVNKAREQKEKLIEEARERGELESN